MAKHTESEWYKATERSWDEAASLLVAQGYERQAGNVAYPALFVKGDETKVLVRNLGALNWHPVDLER